MRRYVLYVIPLLLAALVLTGCDRKATMASVKRQMKV